ncbi:hypothetical protein TorRG33x02_244370 [Trema orientale]|uniref:Uncharacterized protein n=1 Tax=Trema orientale TaxID=63057 RepID=A0A2P5DRA1_TREOI|nr:hypothetical protein TorRG33x02_244370 [Trema orientale]
MQKLYIIPQTRVILSIVDNKQYSSKAPADKTLITTEINGIKAQKYKKKTPKKKRQLKKEKRVTMVCLVFTTLSIYYSMHACTFYIHSPLLQNIRAKTAMIEQHHERIQPLH